MARNGDSATAGTRGADGLLRTGAAVAAGYLLGTIPSADLAARLASRGTTDLRHEGSGNPGAVNAMAVIGPAWGYGVMAADIAKGAVAAGIGRRLAGPTGANLAGSAAVVGHCYPVWNGFRGGKGVAASIGQVAVTFPVYFPIDLTVAGVVVASSRLRQRAFAATAIASVAWIGSSVLWWRKGWRNGWGPEPTVALPLGAVLSSAVIFQRFAAGARAQAADEASSAPAEIQEEEFELSSPTALTTKATVGGNGSADRARSEATS